MVRISRLYVVASLVGERLNEAFGLNWRVRAIGRYKREDVSSG